MKVQFAPGAFDNFDGTQEELDALKAEIEETFKSMTSEEIAAQSRKVDFADLPDHVQDNLIDKPRTLQ
jgi:crotonobetainyl-CoA:carnitine CoA-transferase CaiB-like acyl-CoA transferase